METSYDLVAYPGRAYPATHPDRLSTIATLLGVDSAPPSRARVLELGGGQGANLIPMAMSLPDSEFVGFDLAESAVRSGQALIAELGLRNVRIEARNIMDLDGDIGQFDYIVAHGVFSWVPEPVRMRMLEICRDHLSANGIAYISYNAYPGFHVRAMMREMMRYHVRGFASAREQIEQAKALLQMLGSSRPDDDLFGRLVRTELDGLAFRSDSHLYHDDLSFENRAYYLHEFVDLARHHGLAYLGDAEYSFMVPHDLPAATLAVLEPLRADRVRFEQYLDFVGYRRFRRTLLCRPQQRPDPRDAHARIPVLHAGAKLTVDKTDASLQSGAPWKFVHPSGLTMTTDSPPLKALLGFLAESWPRHPGFAELVAEVGERLGHPEASRGELERPLAASLLRAYELSLVDLRREPPRVAARLPRFPLASPLARLQAAGHEPLTTLLGEQIDCDAEVTRVTLKLLDGTLDRAALLAHPEVREAATIDDDRAAQTGAQGALSGVEARVDRALVDLHGHGFLAG